MANTIALHYTTRSEETIWSRADAARLLDSDYVGQFKQKNFLAIRHRERVDRARSELSLYCDEVHDAAIDTPATDDTANSSSDTSSIGVPSLLIAGRATATLNEADNDNDATPVPSLSSQSATAVPSSLSSTAGAASNDSKASVSLSDDTTNESSSANRIIKRLATDVQRICAQHEGSLVLSSKALWLLRISLAMKRERSLAARKSRAQAIPSISWSALRRQQLRQAHISSQSITSKFLTSVLDDDKAMLHETNKLLTAMQDIDFDNETSIWGHSGTTAGIQRVLLNTLWSRQRIDGTIADTMPGVVSSLIQMGHLRTVTPMLHVIERVLFDSDINGTDISTLQMDTLSIALLNESAIKHRKRAITDTSSSSSSSASGIADGVYSWGRGRMNALGHGDDDNRRRATSIASLSNDGITSIVTFSNHVLALDGKKQVWSWGTSTGGRLGHNSGQQAEKLPRQMRSLTNIIQIAVGHSFSLALTADGDVVHWGTIEDLQQGNSGFGQIGMDQPTINYPQRVQPLGCHHITHIAAGANHALVATTDNLVFAWGKNHKGQLGLGHTSTVKVTAIEEVKALHGIPLKQLAGGWVHSVAVTHDGKVYAWGNSHSGTVHICGHTPGSLADVTTPQIIESLQHVHVVQVAAGWDHTLAVTRDGHLYSWGEPAAGKLGRGGSAEIPSRVDVVDTSGQSLLVYAAAAGATHSGVITRDGRVFVFGSGSGHELGIDHTRGTNRPVLVSSLNDIPVRLLACGVQTSFAIAGVPDYSDHLHTTAASGNEGKEVKDAKSSTSASSSGGISRQTFIAGGALTHHSYRSIVDDEDSRVTLRDGVIATLSIIDRTCGEQVYRRSIKSDTVNGDAVLLQENFSISVTRNNLIRLQRLVILATSRLAKGSVTWTDSYVLVALLRILKSHVSRLVVSAIEPTLIGITIPGIERTVLDEKKAIRSECDRIGFADAPVEEDGISDEGKDEDGIFDIIALKTLLLSLVAGDASSVTASTSLLHDDARAILQQEAIDFLRSGVEILYPLAADRVELVSYLLTSTDRTATLLAPSLLAKLADDHILNAFIPYAPSKPLLSISVTNIDKSKHSVIEIAETATIRQLKLNIRLKWYGWKARRQRLFYGDKELTSGKQTLSDAGLTYGSSLVVVLKADPTVTSSGILIPLTTAQQQQMQVFGGGGGGGGGQQVVASGLAKAAGASTPVVQLSDGNGIYAEELINVNNFDGFGGGFGSPYGSSWSSASGLSIPLNTGGVKFTSVPLMPPTIEYNQGGWSSSFSSRTKVVKKGANTSSSSSSSSSSSDKRVSKRKAKAAALKASLTIVEPQNDEQKYEPKIDSDEAMTQRREVERNDTQAAMAVYKRQQQQFIEHVALLDRLLKLLVDASCEATTKHLRSLANGSTADNGSWYGSAMLRNLQKHVICWTFAAIEEADEKKQPFDTADSLVATSVTSLQRHMRQSIDHGISLTDATLRICQSAGKDDKRVQASIVTALQVLRDSIVGTVLPAYMIGACVVPSSLRLATPMALSVASLLAVLQLLAESVPTITAKAEVDITAVPALPSIAAPVKAADAKVPSLATAAVNSSSTSVSTASPSTPTSSSTSSSSLSFMAASTAAATAAASSSSSTASSSSSTSSTGSDASDKLDPRFEIPTSSDKHNQHGGFQFGGNNAATTGAPITLPPTFHQSLQQQGWSMPPNVHTKTHADPSLRASADDEDDDRHDTSDTSLVWISELQQQIGQLNLMALTSDVWPTIIDDSEKEKRTMQLLNALRTIHRLFTATSQAAFRSVLMAHLSLALKNLHILTALKGAPAESMKELRAAVLQLTTLMVGIIEDDKEPLSVRVDALGSLTWRIDGTNSDDRDMVRQSRIIDVLQSLLHKSVLANVNVAKDIKKADATKKEEEAKKKKEEEDKKKAEEDAKKGDKEKDSSATSDSAAKKDDKTKGPTITVGPNEYQCSACTVVAPKSSLSCPVCSTPNPNASKSLLPSPSVSSSSSFGAPSFGGGGGFGGGAGFGGGMAGGGGGFGGFQQAQGFGAPGGMPGGAAGASNMQWNKDTTGIDYVKEMFGGVAFTETKERIEFEATVWKVFKLLTAQLAVATPLPVASSSSSSSSLSSSVVESKESATVTAPLVTGSGMSGERKDDLYKLPDGLPVPIDDGACDHLLGHSVSSHSLTATDGRDINLAKLTGRTVVYIYPRTGLPNEAPAPGWDTIPGARGCTPQSCSFRDHYAQLQAAGASHVFGLSAQTTGYQKEVVDRLHLPYALLSDTNLQWSHAMNLPTFRVAPHGELNTRLAIIIKDGVVEKYFYPVFPSDRNAADVLAYLKVADLSDDIPLDAREVDEQRTLVTSSPEVVSLVNVMYTELHRVIESDLARLTQLKAKNKKPRLPTNSGASAVASSPTSSSAPGFGASSVPKGFGFGSTPAKSAGAFGAQQQQLQQQQQQNGFSLSAPSSLFGSLPGVSSASSSSDTSSSSSSTSSATTSAISTSVPVGFSFGAPVAPAKSLVAATTAPAAASSSSFSLSFGDLAAGVKVSATSSAQLAAAMGLDVNASSSTTSASSSSSSALVSGSSSAVVSSSSSSSSVSSTTSASASSVSPFGFSFASSSSNASSPSASAAAASSSTASSASSTSIPPFPSSSSASSSSSAAKSMMAPPSKSAWGSSSPSSTPSLPMPPPPPPSSSSFGGGFGGSAVSSTGFMNAPQQSSNFGAANNFPFSPDSKDASSVSHTGDFCFSFWLLVNAKTPGNQVILDNSCAIQSNNNGPYRNRLSLPNIHLQDNNNGGMITTNATNAGPLRVLISTQQSEERIASNGMIPLKKWTHCAVILDGLTVSIYINSRLDQMYRLISPIYSTENSSNQPKVQLGTNGVRVNTGNWFGIDQDTNIMWFANGALASSFGDTYAMQIISLLQHVAGCYPVLLTRRWMTTIFALMHSSQSRHIRVRALQLLRCLLPLVTPVRASLLLTRTRDQATPIDIVNHLMRSVARGIMFSHLKANEPQHESMMLLRHMLALQSSSYARDWQDGLTSALRTSLSDTSKLSAALTKAKVDPDEFLAGPMARTLAAIYVVAGHTLNNTSFMNESLIGSMSTSAGTLGGFELYYYRLSALFELMIRSPSSSSSTDSGKDESSIPSLTMSPSTDLTDDDTVLATETSITAAASSASSSSTSSSSVAASSTTSTASTSSNSSSDSNASSSSSSSSSSTVVAAVAAAPVIPELPIPLSLQQSITALLVTGASMMAVRAALVKAAGRRLFAASYLKKPLDASKSAVAHQQEWHDFLKNYKEPAVVKLPPRAPLRRDPNVPAGVWSGMNEVLDIFSKVEAIISLYGTVNKDGVAPQSRVQFKLNVLATVSGVKTRSVLLVEAAEKEKAKELAESKAAKVAPSASASSSSSSSVVASTTSSSAPSFGASFAIPVGFSFGAPAPAPAPVLATASTTIAAVTTTVAATSTSTAAVVSSSSSASSSTSVTTSTSGSTVSSTSSTIASSSSASVGSSSTSSSSSTATTPAASKSAAKQSFAPASATMATNNNNSGGGWGTPANTNTGFGGGFAPAKSSQGGQYWAKGTGYGHGGNQSNWDPEKQKMEEERKDRAIAAALDDVTLEFLRDTLPDGFARSVEDSCIIPFLEQNLRNDSIVDMERRAPLYEATLKLCAAMVRHTSVASLLLELPGQRTSCYSLLVDMEKQAKVVGKFTESKEEKKSKSVGKQGISLSKLILDSAGTVGRVLRPIIAAKLAEAAKLAAAAGKEDSKDEKTVDIASWNVLMKDQRFKEVKEFKIHHWWTSPESKGAGGRVWTRRLQGEFADLYKSLPLHSDSTIFMRVLNGNMAMAQLLVTAPTDTPYSRGAFLFDVCFPSDYPNVPPKVNLQTTGNGSVRFNPNLYNSGYVCLSLLNTWNGAKEERWNPKASTFLQVCVSLQSLIFVAMPYFNEPGYEAKMNTSAGRELNDDYNANIRNATIKFAMIEQLTKPPAGFEYPTLMHFYLQRDNIIKQVDDWTIDGVSKGNHLSTLKTLVIELKSLLIKLEKPVAPVSTDDDDE